MGKAELRSIANEMDQPTFVLSDPELLKVGAEPAEIIMETWTNLDIAVQRAEDKNYAVTVVERDPIDRFNREGYNDE